MIPLLWMVALTAQERAFSIALPELQYSRQCSSEISIHNPSPRLVDVTVVGHRSTGAVVGLVDKRSNYIRLRPSEQVLLRLDVENEDAWAEVSEVVPHPKLQPVLAVSGKTECLDGNELLTASRDIAAIASDPGFTLDHEAAAGNGRVLLVINASDRRLQWSACYSSGTTVSDGKGGMTPVCSEALERTLAPFQSSRLAASIEGKPLMRFHATGAAVALQMLAPAAPQVRLYKVESTIRFDEPIPK